MGLTGEGILVGIVDSGVDYFHPDFRNEDGSSRILRLWDQSVNWKSTRKLCDQEQNIQKKK